MTGTPGDPVAPPLGGRNHRVQRVRRLASSRRFRAEEQAFVVEGPTLVAEALGDGLVISEVLYEPHADRALLARLAAAGIAADPVHAGVLDAAGDATTSRGLLAVAAMPADGGTRSIPDSGPVLVLAGVADPGNAGTLLRVAEACAFGAVVLTAGSVDPWSPKVVRASAGSVFRVPVVQPGAAAAALDELRRGGRRCVGTRAGDAPSLHTAELPGNVAVVLGNEAHGLDPALDDHLDGWVRIPMAGRVESLNVAMAGTVLAFEVARRRSDS